MEGRRALHTLTSGRAYRASRTVRLGDAGIDGRLRLDTLARFLQDVAADDAADAGLRDATWVVRRTVLELDGRPSVGDRIELTTFCGGLGGRWAERRTSVVGPTSRVEASSLWVYLDPATQRPAPLPALFLDAYAEASGGRKVGGRLQHPAPPQGEGAGLVTRPWPLRASDFDVLGHVNNAVSWSVVDDVFGGFASGRAELEYRLPIEPATDVHVAVETGARLLWLVSGDGVHASARLSS